MNHLEQLIAEWLEFTGYLVKRNINVCKLTRGGFEGELDIVAYNPETNHLLHVEPSGDALSWKDRNVMFSRKFKIGKKYIISDVFRWLPKSTTIEHWAVVWGSDKTHKKVGGGKVMPIKKIYNLIANDLSKLSDYTIIPEQQFLLRTMQSTLRFVDLNNGSD